MKQLQYISVTGGTWFELDHILQYGEKVKAEHVTCDSAYSSGWRHQQMISCGEGEFLRLGMSDGGGNIGNIYYTYSEGDHQNIGRSAFSDAEVMITKDYFYLDGSIIYSHSFTEEAVWTTNMVLFANTNEGADSVEYQTASLGTVTILASDNSIVAEYIPVLDSSNNVCFYNTVSGNYIYKEGTGTPIAGPLTTTISVYGSTSKIGSNGGTVNITVESETSWTASTSANWVTIGTVSGTSATTSTTITVSANTSSNQRTCNIDFVNETGDTNTFPITQKAISNEYIFCDRVSNNGNASIDTGIYPDSATTIDIFITNENTGATGSGKRYVGNSGFKLTTYNTSENSVSYVYGDGSYDGFSFPTGDAFEFKLSNTGMTVISEGTSTDEQITMTDFTTTGETIKIGESGCLASFGRCIIRKGGSVVADLYPCTFRNNVGFYDTVSESFIGDTGFTSVDIYGNLVMGDGDSDIDNINIGGDGVVLIYLGSKPIYANSPFVGLKIGNAELENTSGSTASTVVKSSEPWTLTIDSAATWLSASTLSGATGKTNVTFTATEDNLSTTPRSTIVTATTQSFSATCQVAQKQEGYFYITSVNDYNHEAINLGLPASNDIVIEVKGMWKGIANGQTVIGYYGGYDSYDGWRFFNYTNSLYFDWGNNRINEDSGSYGPSGQTFDFEIGNYYVKDNTTGNDIIQGNPVSSTYQGFDIHVCVGTIWINSIQIYKNNVIVFDGVAKEENGTLGIYDSISGTLYYNPELEMTSCVV